MNCGFGFASAYWNSANFFWVTGDPLSSTAVANIQNTQQAGCGYHETSTTDWIADNCSTLRGFVCK